MTSGLLEPSDSLAPREQTSRVEKLFPENVSTTCELLQSVSPMVFNVAFIEQLPNMHKWTIGLTV